MKLLLFITLILASAYLITSQVASIEEELTNRANKLIERANKEAQVLKQAGREQETVELLKLEKHVQELVKELKNFNSSTEIGKQTLLTIDRELIREENRLDEVLDRLEQSGTKNNTSNANNELKIELLRRAVQLILRARKQHERFAQLGKPQEANGLYVIEITLLELEVQLQAIDITNGGSELREIEAQLLKVENRLDEELDRLEKITTV